MVEGQFWIDVSVQIRETFQGKRKNFDPFVGYPISIRQMKVADDKVYKVLGVIR